MDLGAIFELHTGDLAALDEDVVHRGQGAHFAAEGLDDLHQTGRDHLSAAFGVEGAVHVVVEHVGVKGGDGLLRCTCVEPGGVVDDRLRLLGQLTFGEQVAEGALSPQVVSGAFAAEDVAGLLGHRPQGADAPFDTGLLTGELIDEPLFELVPARRNAEGEIGEVQGVETVGIERAERHPVADAQGAKDRGEQSAGTALAHVVHADVELVPVIAMVAAEHLQVAPGHIVTLEDQHLLARRGQTSSRGETTRPRPDHNRVPLFDIHAHAHAPEDVRLSGL